MSKAPIFLANDTNERNSYGFYVDTSGIDIDARFAANPVCLNNHSNDTKDVLGKWIDIEAKEGLLYMRPDFDTEDPNGKEVVRKVLTGTIKGCSLGIMFDPADMVNENGKLILKKCVLFEVSIVAVPSSSAAIALFTMKGKPMSEQEVKTLCLSLQTAKPFENHITMKQLTAHLQLEDNAGENAILDAVKTIEANLTAAKNEYAELKTKYDALEAAQTAKLQADYDALKTVALKDGRIDAEALKTVEELPVEKRIDLLNKLPKRKTVKEQVETEENKGNAYEKLSFSDLRKKGLLATLKADNYELYAEKFEEEFGKKPSDYKTK